MGTVRRGSGPSFWLDRATLAREIAIRGWTWNDLADAAEIGHSTLYVAWTRGGRVSTELADRIAKALEANPPNQTLERLAQ